MLSEDSNRLVQEVVEGVIEAREELSGSCEMYERNMCDAVAATKVLMKEDQEMNVDEPTSNICMAGDEGQENVREAKCHGAMVAAVIDELNLQGMENVLKRRDWMEFMAHRVKTIAIAKKEENRDEKENFEVVESLEEEHACAKRSIQNEEN